MYDLIVHNNSVPSIGLSVKSQGIWKIWYFGGNNSSDTNQLTLASSFSKSITSSAFLAVSSPPPSSFATSIRYLFKASTVFEGNQLNKEILQAAYYPLAVRSFYQLWCFSTDLHILCFTVDVSLRVVCFLNKAVKMSLWSRITAGHLLNEKSNYFWSIDERWEYIERTINNCFEAYLRFIGIYFLLSHT